MNNSEPNISLIINAHREGLLLAPAFRSMISAATECAARGISTEIVVVGDKVDVSTRKVIEQFRNKLSVVKYVEFGNLGSARQEAIDIASGEFYCFLDGDDIWQTEWPALAYAYAKNNDYLNCIYHTELFAGFGVGTSFVRKQLSSNDPVFHPLHLATSWHFCNNLFAHASIFSRVPLEPYDHSKGYGSEDWHWSCETLANGIARAYVPNTVYFYRRDPNRPTLGMIAGLVLKPTALFKDISVLSSYAAFSGLSDDCSAALLSVKNQIRYFDDIPSSLYREAKRAAMYDSDIYELIKSAGSLRCESPDINVGASYLFARAAEFCHESFSIVSVDCETLPAEQVGALQLGIRRAATDNHRIMVLCGDILTAQQLVRQEGNVCYFNCKMIFRSCNSIAYLFDQAFGNFLSNFRPKSITNINFELIDYFCGSRSRFLLNQEIKLLRYLGSRVCDIKAAYNDRRILAHINQTVFTYTHLAVCDEESFDYVSEMYGSINVETVRFSGKLSNIGALISSIEETPKSARPPTSELELTAKLGHKMDVSCILNLHREGMIVVPTFKSIARALDFAQQQGIHCELVIVLDNADEQTRACALKAQSGALSNFPVSIFEVSNGDLGCSRRDGVAKSVGDYIAFLDGDDLYSENWIAEAFSMAKVAPSEASAVYHPEVNVYFGVHHRTFWHPNLEKIDPSPKAGLLLENYWTSLSFGHRSIYVENPVHDNGIDDGHGYEDWHWNMDTFAKGIKHIPVPQTLHFIRLKPTGSLNSNSSARNVIVRPSSLAHQLIFGTPDTNQRAIPQGFNK